MQQQSREKLCTAHQEVIVQNPYNNLVQCLNSMEIRHKNEIIKLLEAIKEQQRIINSQKWNKKYNLNIAETIKQKKIVLIKNNNKEFCERIIKHSNQKARKINYQLLNNKYPRRLYYSFLLNSDSTLLFAGDFKKIKLFKIKHGYKLLQTLTKHTFYIFNLIFMNKSSLLVSGSEDRTIVICNQGYNSNWEPYQTLEGHQGYIRILINNEDEDLLISGSMDKTIKFWRKINMNWICQQTIQFHVEMRNFSDGIGFSTVEFIFKLIVLESNCVSYLILNFYFKVNNDIQKYMNTNRTRDSLQKKKQLKSKKLSFLITMNVHVNIQNQRVLLQFHMEIISIFLEQMRNRIVNFHTLLIQEQLFFWKLSALMDYNQLQ